MGVITLTAHQAAYLSNDKGLDIASTPVKGTPPLVPMKREHLGYEINGKVFKKGYIYGISVTDYKSKLYRYKKEVASMEENLTIYANLDEEGWK